AFPDESRAFFGQAIDVHRSKGDVAVECAQREVVVLGDVLFADFNITATGTEEAEADGHGLTGLRPQDDIKAFFGGRLADVLTEIEIAGAIDTSQPEIFEVLAFFLRAGGRINFRPDSLGDGDGGESKASRGIMDQDP